MTNGSTAKTNLKTITLGVILLCILILTAYTILKPTPTTTTTTTTLGQNVPVTPEQVLDDITQVDQYFNEHTLDGCVKITEIRSRNPRLSLSTVDACFYNIALLQVNASYCELITNTQIKEECNLKVSQKTQQKQKELSQICNRIKEQIEYEIQNWGQTTKHPEYEPYLAQCNITKNGAN